ncbi:MAG: hypothetical protein ABI175_05445, partial [Polyangiales bacterium]
MRLPSLTALSTMLLVACGGEPAADPCAGFSDCVDPPRAVDSATLDRARPDGAVDTPSDATSDIASDEEGRPRPSCAARS